MTTPGPRVFVVDDDPSVRRGLTRLLAAAGYAVEAFASGREFLATASLPGPSCLVVDVKMPGLGGLDLQDALTTAGRRMGIVFISGYGDVPTSVRAMKHGAADFLGKPVDGRDLLDAVRRALAKDTLDRREEARVQEVRARVGTLTPREVEVLALVVTGLLNKQVAAVLGIGEKTVKVHRARVMEKMQARSMADLVRMADRAGVIVPRS